MLKKFAFFAIWTMLLCGCGASSDQTPEEADFHTRDSTAAYCYSDCTKPTEETREQAGSSDVQYFVFDRQTSTHTDDSGIPLLHEQLCSGAFQSSDTEENQLVNSVLSEIQEDFTSNSDNLLEYARDFLEQNGPEQFYSYSNYQELGIARHDEQVISLLSLSSLYSGGSHPNSVQTAWNLDLEQHRVLRLEDVILEESAERLRQMVYQSVRDRYESLGEDALFADYPDTIATSMTYGRMTPYWYLNDDGLVIFYNQYELGPYAVGIIKVQLPYSDLDGILRAEFFPQERDSSFGELVLTTVLKGKQPVSITIDDGKTLCIGVLGQIYQVQLSEIYWLEDTPILQEMIFSAAAMDSDDVICITGGFDDETRSFAIEFQNGEGEGFVYYIHEIGLSDAP